MSLSTILLQRFRSTCGLVLFPDQAIRTTCKLATVTGFTLVLAACGGDSTSSITENNNANSNPSSDAVVQRFGTRTVRELNPQSNADTESQVIDGFNNLSLQLLREQSESEPGENTVNSGYSLAVALSMLQRGAANSDFNLMQQLLGVSAIGKQKGSG